MITSIQPKFEQRNLNRQQNQSFKGAPELLATSLNFMNTNPALGALFVDIAFMDTPRTIVDTARNPDAGVETAAREYSSTINHSVAGFVGLGAGYLAASGFNKANGVKAHMLFTNSDSLDVFGKFVEESRGGSEPAQQYYQNILKELKGYNSSVSKESPWRNVSDETIKEVSKMLAEAKTDKYKLSKDIHKQAKFMLIGDTAAAETFKINKNGKEIQGSLENILNDAFSIRKAFIDKAEHDLKEGAKKLTDKEFLESLKKIKTRTALGGLAVPVAIGMSLQPLNAYMTKKRTGKEGFVGVEGREPDKSTGFKVLKTGMGAGIAAAMLRTIGPYKEILPKLQYKGLVPTLPQFKLIYSMTILSRMMAARDKDELRESTIKDTLGFVNWLILGGFVSKLAAKGFNKDLINYDEKTHGKGNWNWITKAVEKTHEEILYPALKKAGIKAVDAEGKVLSYGKLMKALAEKAKDPSASNEIKEAFKTASSRIKYKNAAQLLGYLYSGVVLGVGIPKLNIAITNHINKKRAQKTPKAPQQQEPVKMASIDAQNKAFASFFGSSK